MRLGMLGELIPVKGFSRAGRGKLPASSVSGWVTHDGILAVSGCHIAPLPGTDGVPGKQWLVSVSRPAPGVMTPPTHASDDDLRRVVECFAMPAFDEDNHHPGIARHLWCPQDETARLACECKISETLIVEDDGYTWTNDEDAPCRGCIYAIQFGSTCPIHRTSIA